MPGKHDRVGASSRLLATGPIVVRGLPRGMKDALQQGGPSRHRAAVIRPDDSDSAVREDRASTTDASSSETPAEQEDPTVATRRQHDPEGRPEAADAAGEGGDAAAGAAVDRPGSKADGDGAPAAPASDGDRAGVQEATEIPPEQAEPGGGLFADLASNPQTVRRERRGLEWINRGLIGVAVLVVLALVCAGLIVAVIVKTQNDAALAAREAASYTPPPLTSSSSASGLSGPVAVIADDAASRAASGVAASKRWPRLVGSTLGADVDLTATSGSGYASGSTFVKAAGKVPVDASVVLFVGGAADDGTSSLALARAATQAFSAAIQRAPDATVIAVGPLFRPSDVTEADFDQLRTTLRSAARIAGVRWVDPVTAGWTSSVRSTSDLSATDERTIADRMEAAITSAR